MLPPRFLRFCLFLILVTSPALACRALAFSSSDLNGTWKGTYTCNQGLTDLRLEISENSPSQINATFSFSASPTNPNVPSGSYKMTGFYDTGTRQLTLNASQWINQPAGYMMVGLNGVISQDNKDFSGTVIGPNCTAFTLVKQ